MFLVDTNVVSEFRKLSTRRADPNVADWAARTPIEHLYLSAMTIMELEIGALLVERRDPRQGAVLRKWFDGYVVPSFDGRILPFDDAAAIACARLHVPDPRAPEDAMIAATALVHGLTVVTRNTRDFAPMGVRLLNPWELAA